MEIRQYYNRNPWRTILNDIAAHLPEVPFNTSWHVDEAALNPIFATDLCDVGESVFALDEIERCFLIHRTPFGNIVIYNRFNDCGTMAMVCPVQLSDISAMATATYTQPQPEAIRAILGCTMSSIQPDKSRSLGTMLMQIASGPAYRPQPF